MTKMKEEEIARLLQRYMDAETTAEEENMLRRCFERGDYPPHLAPYAEMLGVAAHDFPALTDVEADELLHLCPAAAVRPQRHVRRMMRYAAVWLCGLLLGGVVAWLSRPDNTAFTAAPETARIAAARVDTLIRERVIVQSDTVYMVKYRTLSAGRGAAVANGRRDVAATDAPHAAGAANSVSGAPNTVSSDKNVEERMPVQDISWDKFTNLADLAER